MKVTLSCVGRGSSLLLSFAIALSATAADENQNELPPDEAIVRLPFHDSGPFLPIAEAAALREYPDIFTGRFEGTIELAVDLDLDGNVLGISKFDHPPGPLGDKSFSKEQRTKLLDELHDTYLSPGARGQKFVGWFGSDARNGLYLDYRVLKWPLDFSRSVARVHEAIAKKYPEFYGPHALQVTERKNTKLLTVLLNDDGSIRASTLSDGDGSDVNRTLERFRVLGAAPDQLTHRGRTTNHGELADRNQSAPLLVIEYAWLRHADEPQDPSREPEVFRKIGLQAVRQLQQQVSSDLFLRRYFADVWKLGPNRTDEVCWLLLDRQGRVIDTGRSAKDTVALMAELNRRRDVIKVEGPTSTTVTTPSGARTTVAYFWIAADSPALVQKPRDSNRH